MSPAQGLSWKIHAFRRRPVRGMFGLALVAAALWLVQSWGRIPLLTFLGGLLLLVSLWPFYFPVRYRIDDQGVGADYGLWRRRWSWERFRTYVPLSDAILLSPFTRSCHLERYRSLLLPCPENAPAVEAHLAGRLTRREPEAPA